MCFVADNSLHSTTAPVQVTTPAFTICVSSSASAQIPFITPFAKEGQDKSLPPSIALFYKSVPFQIGI